VIYIPLCLSLCVLSVGGSHIPFHYRPLEGSNSSSYLPFYKGPNMFLRARWSSCLSCLFSCFLPWSCNLGIRHPIFRSMAVLFIYGGASRSSSCRNRFTRSKPALACEAVIFGSFSSFYLSLFSRLECLHDFYLHAAISSLLSLALPGSHTHNVIMIWMGS
jgi:hypothetical protein